MTKSSQKIVLFIEPGDDFGFTETSSFFGDAKEFSPTRKVDI